MSASKLSEPLKALLTAAHARGDPLPALSPTLAAALFGALESSAKRFGLSPPVWLTLSTAALVTLNSPANLCHLYNVSGETVPSNWGSSIDWDVERASVMREAALKCISFSGIPRTINALGALRANLPQEVVTRLPKSPTRLITPSNAYERTVESAGKLWTSVYAPFDEKLLSKLSASHPDLPYHILSSHYGPLLSDPNGEAFNPEIHKIGRELTSIVAIACLRAQQGVQPQLLSHVFGLQKSRGEQSKPGTASGLSSEEKEWLTNDEGCIWVLQEVDKIVEAVSGGKGSFAAVVRSEL